MAITRLLITALGGEGGGVLTNWIIDAANAENIPAQATSVPGVAQRTGATTYYLEFADKPGAKAPIFALMPVAGDIDVAVASELLEAVRIAERGFITPERTFLLGSTHRALTTFEKTARGDGTADAAELMKAAEQASRARFFFEPQAISLALGVPVNAVMLGALATFDVLPVKAKTLRVAIERGGIAVAQNLKGFDAGLAAAKADGGQEKQDAQASAQTRLTVLADEIAAVPEAARETCRLGVARLVGYQDKAYARLYLDRLEPFADDPDLMREVARHLAVRMSFEDIIRVAQLKIRQSRLERVRNDVRANSDDPVEIVDFFKPGIPEAADLLPPMMGRRLVAWAQRRGIMDTANFGMKVRTNTIFGFLRLWWLAKLKPWRRRSWRFANEQADIAAWLDLVTAARAVSHDFAMQTADLARLVKGYGETYRRGQASYRKLVDELVAPALASKAKLEEPAAQLRGAIAGLLIER